MPCIRISNGFLCLANEPVTVGKYQFEWTASSGWVPVNKDGSGRLSPVPDRVWAEVEKLARPEDGVGK